MSKVFSYDSPVWIFMGRLIDFLVLTILWAVTSLPIITMGTATATVYDISLKMAENRDGYLFQMYFQTFGRLWKSTIKAWLAILVTGLILAGDIFICLRIKTPITTVFLAAFALVSIVYILTTMYLLPTITVLENTLLDNLKISFYLSIRYFGWSLLMLTIAACILTVGIFIFWPLLLLSIGLIAYLQSLILNQIYTKQIQNYKEL